MSGTATLPATVSALARTAHGGPTLAVTVLVAALGVATGLEPGRLALVTGAVLAGQLTIGWSNDLVDRGRDRQVGRADKPLATGELSPRSVAVALGVASVATVLLSLACGLVPGLVHLACVASGWAYNLGLKATVLSWLPYAFTFGGLPVFVSLADSGPGDAGGWPPWWLPVAAAMLGVGAHLVNALPDLSDDEATGVRGLPHRIGARWTPVLAVAVLVSATAVTVAGATVPAVVLVPAVLVVAGLAVVALTTHGRTPFQAAVGIALVDAVMLVVGR